MKTKIKPIAVLDIILLAVGIAYLSPAAVIAESPEDPSVYRESIRDEARARMRSEGVQSEAQIEASTTLRNSTNLYGSIVKGPQGQIPESVLAKAQCIVVLPDVRTGALVIGGTHGSGVGSCRENNRWSAPAFLQMSAVSLGAQIGGKSSDTILFIIDDKAKTALKNGKLTLGADASVTAGTFDKGADTSASGVVAYTRSEGAFMGASLSGATITGDDASTMAFYGKEISSNSLLSGRSSTRGDDQVDRFIAMLPR